MNKKTKLSLLQVGIILIASLTAGMDFNINQPMVEYYFNRVAVSGYVVAGSLATILGILPPLITRFFSEKLLLLGGFAALLAASLFLLIFLGAIELGRGLFGPIVVLLCFLLNLVLSAYYHLKKTQYLPLIRMAELEKLLPKLKHTEFLKSSELEIIEQEVKKNAVKTIELKRETVRERLAKKVLERNGLVRHRDEEQKRLRKFTKTLDSIIEQAFNNFQKLSHSK